jgi:hypothetical protein
MTEDFRLQRISDLIAALVTASRLVKTNTPTKLQAAAVAEGEDDAPIATTPRKNHGQLDRSLVSNIVAMEMLRMQKEASE